MQTCYFRQLSARHLAVLNLDRLTVNTWRISRINVPAEYRGRGIGSILMQEMNEDADRQNATIILEPTPYDDYPNAYNDLVSFYKANDFEYSERTEDVEGVMIRYPKNTH